MKTVDTNVYVSVLRDLVEEGKEVGLLISGNSMAPFLVHERDYIYFKKPDRELKRGDMVFYQRLNGQFIMHRIFNVAPDGYYLVGDNQVTLEGPIDRAQIFALVTKVKRKNHLIGPDNLLWKFFADTWIRIIPARRLMGRVRGKIERTVKGQD